MRQQLFPPHVAIEKTGRQTPSHGFHVPAVCIDLKFLLKVGTRTFETGAKDNTRKKKNIYPGSQADHKKNSPLELLMKINPY